MMKAFRSRPAVYYANETLFAILFIFFIIISFTRLFSLPFVSKCFQSLRTYRRFGVVVRTKAKRHIKRAVTFLDVRDFFKNCVLLADEFILFALLENAFAAFKDASEPSSWRRQRHLATVSHWSSSNESTMKRTCWLASSRL